jgi:hypothetical protein
MGDPAGLSTFLMPFCSCPPEADASSDSKMQSPTSAANSFPLTFPETGGNAPHVFDFLQKLLCIKCILSLSTTTFFISNVTDTLAFQPSGSALPLPDFFTFAPATAQDTNAGNGFTPLPNVSTTHAQAAPHRSFLPAVTAQALPTMPVSNPSRKSSKTSFKKQHSSQCRTQDPMFVNERAGMPRISREKHLLGKQQSYRFLLHGP